MDLLQDLRTPVSPEQVLPRQLSSIQGNILQGHGLPHVVLAVMQFPEGLAGALRPRLQAFAPQVSSAAGGEELFTGFALSATGYRALEISLEGFHPEFAAGMASRPLGDPPREQWEPHLRRIDALAIFAHREREAAHRAAAEFVRQFHEVAAVSLEPGAAIVDAQGRQREHFGYVDGISQPQFFRRTPPPAIDRWDPHAGPYLVLTEDPRGAAPWDAGSYLVFRKLEQNVRAFRLQARKMAAMLGISTELAGAYTIGRFPDGTPLALQGQPGLGPQNDFDYRDDRVGARCPIAAHARKMNPRGTSYSHAERASRIARRSIPYGEFIPPETPLEEVPEHGRGMLFLCCQRHIPTQFEMLARAWASSPDFPAGSRSGRDPIVGVGGGSQKWPRFWNSSACKRFAFHNVVRLLGGEYLFLPSLGFLRTITRQPRVVWL